MLNRELRMFFKKKKQLPKKLYTISDLISDLEKAKATFGDLPVAANGHNFVSNRICMHPDEYYWDGGYVASFEDSVWHHSKWSKSRTLFSEYDMPKNFLRITVDEPCETEDTVDGISVDEIIDPNT